MALIVYKKGTFLENKNEKNSNLIVYINMRKEKKRINMD
jgi:hypothetical protein